MSDIKQIRVNGTDYNIKDESARNSITSIGSKIPSEASSTNKLADKAWVEEYIQGLDGSNIQFPLDED